MRSKICNKQRIVFKIGSSSLTHGETGSLDFVKMEKLVRLLSDLSNQGKEIILVSSGAVAVGMAKLRLEKRPTKTETKQACAAVGQSRLMMVYQQLFSEYNKDTAQILMTKYTVMDDISRANARNTFNELLSMGVIPIVNENDTIATDEIDLGDNDLLSAVVVGLVKADMLVILSDTDGLFTDDPSKNKDAKLIPFVEKITDEMLGMAKDSNSKVGTGGMKTKIGAASIANDAGADAAILNANNLNNIVRLFSGEEVGTVFKAHKTEHFHLKNYLEA